MHTKLLPADGLERGGTEYVSGVKDVAQLESKNILHTENTVSTSAFQTIGRQQLGVYYTTCCKTQSCAHEDGQKFSRNMLSWLEYQ